jgi:hypothetical protein
VELDQPGGGIMARKTLTLVIDKPGRDHEKVFVLTEMDADKGEEWAIQVLILLVKSRPDIPKDIISAGWHALGTMGIQALGGIDYKDLKPLLAEMLTCAKFMPDPNKPNITRPIGLGGANDIEEIATYIQLRKEIFNLHANFSSGGADSGSTTSAPQG